MEKKNCLISGAAGFLGSHVADALLEAGHEVTIYDKVVSPYLREGQKMVVGDILNRRKLFQELRRIDTVYHFAALADMDKDWCNPRETIKINVLGTMNILEAMRLNGIKRFIFASSLYADNDEGLYGVSKQMGELLTKAYHKFYGVDYTILRFGTLYGSRCGEENSIYQLLKRGLTEKAIFGSLGEGVREYIHVKDAAKICAEIINQYSGETLIITGCQRIKVSEVMDIINEMLGKPIIQYYPDKSQSHYYQTPCRFNKEIPKKIFPLESRDFGASLKEILEEINVRNAQQLAKIEEK